ncbi:C4-dicarboxylate ABC transporter substrate-binding protein [Longimycelium tulufanense]|uniref:C4-dicarboxylate ABC transporter substrate-binding protein n=1 Tax=Longimycelium tulufanense TaxID=907463 RepID=A0A8J3FUU3_9PSEU|nr:TAXI family TRAP transporter solute-binding subunit [Longimycelium tulufanense]GGM62026.1 C4-dicarboxylate ABC transporter substrate-binding protein [Longimycelium tulufanense]
MPPIRRRAALALLGALPLLAAGCSGPSFPGLRLRVATGGTDGVYHALGQVMADAWHEQLDVPRPEVLVTAGSVANVSLVRERTAHVGFSQVDAAVEPTGDPTPLRALARMHDDYMHVVVRADADVHRLADLRGLRVSVGAVESGVQLIAHRLLAVAGLDPGRDLALRRYGINDSVRQMLSGGIDAFFWSGGLPTSGVRTLSEEMAVRLLDLGELLPALRRDHQVYDKGTIPASTYRAQEPVTALVVRNFLVVRENMDDELAEALTRGLFAALPRLTEANPAARTIGLRAAIGTAPVALHPGAERYYRSAKLH